MPVRRVVAQGPEVYTNQSTALSLFATVHSPVCSQLSTALCVRNCPQLSLFATVHSSLSVFATVHSSTATVTELAAVHRTLCIRRIRSCSRLFVSAKPATVHGSLYPKLANVHSSLYPQNLQLFTALYIRNLPMSTALCIRKTCNCSQSNVRRSCHCPSSA